MVQLEAIFSARDGIGPDFAAEVSNCAARFESSVALKSGDRLMRLGSLISILAMDLRKGARVALIAEGSDEEEAATALKELLEG